MASPSTPSGDIAVTAGAAVTGAGTSGRLMHAYIFGGSAASSIVLYDGTSTSGTVLCRFNVAATTCWSDHFGDGIPYNTGLFVVVAGTAAIGGCGFVKG